MPVPPPKPLTTSCARLRPVIGMPGQRGFYFGMPYGHDCFLVLYWNLKANGTPSESFGYRAVTNTALYDGTLLWFPTLQCLHVEGQACNGNGNDLLN